MYKRQSNGPAFGVYVALPTGGPLVALPNSTARLQVIHNSADAAAATVDVYLNGGLLLNDFAFRTATPFIDAPAGVPIKVAIAPSTSTSVADSIAVFNYNLASGETYILIAEGIVSPSGYSPATPFDIAVYGMGREMAMTAGNTDVLVHHGATDAPAVDVVEVGVGAGTIVSNAAYGDFAGYLGLATADYRLEIRATGATTAVATYDAPLATLNLQDSAITVIASGFLDPTQNSNGAAFGLYVALPEGGSLVPLPVVTSIETINTINGLDVRIQANINQVSLQVNADIEQELGIRVLSFDGKVMYDNPVNQILSGDNQLQFNTNLGAGLYVLQLTNKGKIMSVVFPVN